MEIIVFILLGAVLTWIVVGIIRVNIISRHVDRRIEEVFASPNWCNYHIDIADVYSKVPFHWHLWAYRDFFPEAVK